MKTMKTIDFITFLDGVVTIAGVDHHFAETGVSFRRHYAAQTAGVKIARVIYIPYTTENFINALCVIGGNRYIIENCQATKKTFPPSTVLTLTDYEVTP